jgi:thiamine biosynthesis lipoprotein
MKPKHNYAFDALGTHWFLETLDSSIFTKAFCESIDHTVNQFVKDYSRFDTKSLIGKLNTSGTVRRPSRELRAMLTFARKMFDASEGVFNISIGGALHERGYGSQQQAARIWKNPWPAISIDAEHVTIPSDMTIDFGGFGKGWLIDKLAAHFNTNGVTEFIINGGGDLYVHALNPVEIGLEHPYDPTKTIGSTRVTVGGIGVSSNIKRTWQKDGHQHAHILSPQQDQSIKSPVISSYVRAKSALIADTMATILLLRPDLEKKLARIYDLKIILLTEDMLPRTNN